MLLNARSLFHKMDELSVVVQLRNPEVVCITETWLNETVDSSLMFLESYTLHRTDRCYRRGGGVAVYIRRELDVEDITSQFEQLDSVEYLVLDITSLRILLVCIYVPPSLASETLKNVHARLISISDTFLLKKPHYRQVITGDMNHLDVLSLCLDLGLNDIVKRPTRGDRILDHVLMIEEMAEQYDPERVLYDSPIGNGDHKVITCIPNCTRAQPKIVAWKRVYDMRQSNMEYLGHQASLVDWTNLVSEGESVNASTSAFHGALSDLVSRCIPSRMIAITSNDKSWMTPVTKSLIIDKWSAYRRGDWGKYNHLKKKVREEILKSKQIWAEKCTKNANGLWKLVKQITKKENMENRLWLNNALSGETIANLRNDLQHHYDSSCLPVVSDIPVFSNCDNDWNITITEHQVWKLLKRLPTKKAAGMDDVPTRVYVELASQIAAPLAVLYNNSCKQRIFPDMWKNGAIIPIPKTNPPDIKKMRFITLLPTPSKLFEKIVLQNLRSLFNAAYGPQQHGFRPGASTTTALLTVMNEAGKKFDDPSNFGVAIVNFDLSSAFDFVDHSRMVQKLREMDFPKCFLAWLQSYFCDRTGTLQLNGERSLPFDICRGVPQGSVLGPPLFCAYIRSFSAKSVDAQTVKYADDMSLIVPLSSRSKEEIETKIDEETTNMMEWCAENNMRLNVEKSKCLLVTRRKVEGLVTTVEIVRSVRLLGVHLNDRLNWNAHIEHIRKTCGRRLHILRRLRTIMGDQDLLKVYESLIRAVLEYACPVFIGANRGQARTLQGIQKRALRIINRNPGAINARSLEERRLQIGHNLWKIIEKDRNHVLSACLPHKLPRSGHYSLPSYRSDIYGNTFFPFVARYLNSL